MENSGVNIFKLGGVLSMIFGLLSAFLMWMRSNSSGLENYQYFYYWSLAFLILSITTFFAAMLFGLSKLKLK